jgi:hypothetical protein
MTEFYVLSNARGQTLGIFTTVENAMQRVYLDEIYQVYRGYTVSPRQFIWENDSNINWYARRPADLDMPRMNRPAPVYEIHIATLDWMGPVADEVRKFAERFPPQNELMPVVDYWRASEIEG